MTVKIGDALPAAHFGVMTPDGPATRTTDEVFKGRRVALIGVPGAFTPTCSNVHLPNFVNRLDDFKEKGVDLVALTAVNDVFVLNAWAKENGAGQKIMFLADGSGVFAKALGLTLDLSERGLGTRSQRYSMLVENGVVKILNVEDSPGKAEASSAETLLRQL